MKPWSTPSCRRARTRGRTIRLMGRCGLAASLLLLVSSGCVTRGTHNEIVSERDGLTRQKSLLQQKVRNLEASNAALEEELGATLEQYEDLSLEREGLSKRVEHLEVTETVLSEELGTKTKTLEETSAALAAARLEVARLGQTYDSLVNDLEAEVSSGQIEIEQLREGIRLNLKDDILFASGSAELDPIGQKVLQKVIDQLLTMNHMIEVQGHTDDRKISRRLAKRFPSNWDLAAARAARVVRLMETSGVEGERLSATAYASFRPVAGNDTPEDRSLNRRIEIRLIPRRGADVQAESSSDPVEPDAQSGSGPSAASPPPVAETPAPEPASPPPPPHAAPGESASSAASVSASLAAAGEATPTATDAGSKGEPDAKSDEAPPPGAP